MRQSCGSRAAIEPCKARKVLVGELLFFFDVPQPYVVLADL